MVKEVRKIFILLFCVALVFSSSVCGFADSEDTVFGDEASEYSENDVLMTDSEETQTGDVSMDEGITNQDDNETVPDPEEKDTYSDTDISDEETTRETTEEEIDLSGTIEKGNKPFGDSDRIWFYNASGGAFGSDMILVESNGRYGLIDTGNRYDNTITDADGTVYNADQSEELSCQIPGRCGKDGMLYMIETLGVDHLDFIIATHSHSDHIGGIPEISEIKITDETGDAHYLIDSNTLYFYKNYSHISEKEDDLGEVCGSSWHNQAFLYQALLSMNSREAALVDISFPTFDSPEYSEGSVNYALSDISAGTEIESLQYYAGNTGDQYDDNLSFSWGNMNFKLYNLFPSEETLDENVNSIVTVISVGDKKIYLAGDLDIQGSTEQKIAEVIAAHYGNIDIVKASHHGYNYSNSKTLIDLFKPGDIIVISGRDRLDGSVPSISYRTMKYYTERYYNTRFYEVGASEKMLVCELGEEPYSIKTITGEGSDARLTDADSCLDSAPPTDGWSGWYQNYMSSVDAIWYYFRNGRNVTGWNKVNDNWFFFDEEGFMLSNTWVAGVKEKYWLTESGKMAANAWAFIDGEWYYFDNNGHISVNCWAKDSKGWCRLDRNGRIIRSSWIIVDGEWYYLKSDGYMASNEWTKDSIGWMYMDGAGKIIKSKWIRVDGEWYYLKSDGYMAINTWIKDSKGWCYLGSEGKLVRNGWAKDSIRWCWMDSTGYITKSKWIKVDREWYYLKSNGYMAANEWAKDSVGWMYMDGSGKITKSTWIKYKGSWYYLKANGYMATGTQVIKGSIYRFDFSGKWVG